MTNEPPPIPDDLLEVTSTLVSLRQKPTTAARFKQYPALLQKLREGVAACEDVATLKGILERDTGYYLPAGYRQQVLERLLDIGGRTPDVLRQYARQLELFGDVDEWGEADIDIDARVEALEAEADQLEAK